MKGSRRDDSLQLSEVKDTNALAVREWWESKRAKYNMGLIVAGITAFFSYAILGGILIAPYDNSFEVTLFTTFFQGIGYLIMMLIANLFYSLGYVVDNNFNEVNSEVFRQRLFNFGFWFSILLPFTIPALIVLEYLIRFS
ncbi:hypothetical protein ACSX1A_11330 [Pontibacter sp. MBLB2868]|uniref:hypothetical protein n=1 Tax=Pontibacter sp. MBLB2868 TaxID=3451555 RepID=UPI003F74E958